MSAVDHGVDKSACEGFFGPLKDERIYRTRYPTLDVASADAFEYIERRINLKMRRKQAKQNLKFSTILKQSVIAA